MSVFHFESYSSNFILHGTPYQGGIFFLDIINVSKPLSLQTAKDDPQIPGIAHLYLADRPNHDELAAE
ncbi:unnamed protein product [Linum tenue]|uniref:Uncharacterized protein n=1 Tax=Linum tenue TaxID=586396 RepID=A0AAV0KXU7_9ROSI|nr:unnamed protein product [Linum tenue]